jgi:hypothetical protein
MSTKANAFVNPIIAALEACAKRRWRAAEFDGTTAADVSADLSAEAQGAKAEARSATAEPNDIDRTVAIIDAAAEKIEGGDYSGVEFALAAQALALDVIFDQFVRRSAVGENLYQSPMGMAFRAQMQCRVTYKNLMAVRNPRASQNSSRRTIESEKVSA